MAKILVIEDNSEVLEMITLVLTTFGYEVVGVSDKFDIDTKLTEWSPQLVLVDVLLRNNLSGKEICQTIKKIKPDLPIILMSANTKQLQDFESCKANDVLEKPFDIALLKKKIEKLLVV